MIMLLMGMIKWIVTIRIQEQSSQLVSALVQHPRTLYELWQDYEFRSTGKKAAKDFTSSERERV